MVPSPDPMQLTGSIKGAQHSRKKAPLDSLQNLCGTTSQDNIFKCFLICLECWLLYMKTYFPSQCELECETNWMTFESWGSHISILILKTPCPSSSSSFSCSSSSSMLNLVCTGSPCLLSRCFALPCTSTEGSRRGRSGPFFPSPHSDLLCALLKDTWIWFSQTATIGWSLHQGKLAHGLGGLPAWSSLLDLAPIQMLRTSLLQVFLGTEPFGVPGSLEKKTSDLSIASFPLSNYSVALKRIKYPSNPSR